MIDNERAAVIKLEVRGTLAPLPLALNPSLTSEKTNLESTQDCIDNFNRNFGDDGVYKDYRDEVGWAGELTMDKLLDDFSEMTGIIDKWGDLCNEELFIDLNGATVDWEKGEDEEKKK